jgi:hypothetical protein
VVISGTGPELALGRLQLPYSEDFPIDIPPSTCRACPVMNAASSDSRNSIARQISPHESLLGGNQHLLDGRQHANAFINDVFGDALELMWVELHHVLILNVVRLIDKFADHVIVVFDVEDPEQLDFLVADVCSREFGSDGVHVIHLGN